MPTCFVPGCNSNKKGGKSSISFHGFPQDRKDVWLKAIGRDEKTFIIQQRVCSKHFNAADYETRGARNILKPTAIPSINLPKQLTMLSASSLFNKSLDEVKAELSKAMASSQSVSQVRSPEESVILPPSAVADQDASRTSIKDLAGMRKRSTFLEPRQGPPDTCFPPKRARGVLSSISPGQASTSSASPATKNKMIKLFHNYSMSPGHYTKQIEHQKNIANFYKSKYASAARTSSRRTAKMVQLKTVVQQLKEKSLCSSNVIEMLENTFDGIPLAIMKRIAYGKKGKSDTQQTKAAYPKELKAFAMTLQFYNTKAYDYVRQTFNLALPAPSTIRAWLSKVDCTPGISAPSIELLSRKAKEHYQKHNKPLLLALSLDEMSIKKEIMIEKHSQSVWGYIDFGADIPVSGNDEVASEVLVVMVVGVNSLFKLPIAYFFIAKLTGEEKANIVKEILHHLNIPHLKIITLTCDGPYVNFKMMAELGCSVTDPENFQTYWTNPSTGEKVYVLFDICHMLKLVRNNWATAGVFIDPDGNAIKWDYIIKLHQIQTDEGLYLSNKIRKRHMDWKKAVMKVNLAAQTLSTSVADALEFLMNDLLLEEFQGAEATIKFIRTIDQLFDLLNSQNPYGRGMKTPLKPANELYWKPFLEGSIQYLLKIKNTSGKLLHSTNRKVPILGFAISGLSLLQVYEEQVLQLENLQYVLTYKFSQDHLELFFCSIRSRNGWNNNPNCLQFIRSYKRLLLHNEIRSNTGNCVAQDQTLLLTLTSTKKRIELNDIHLQRSAEDDETISTIRDKIKLFLPVHLNEYTENVVSYIAGFVVRMVERKVRCAKCREALRFSGDAEGEVGLKLILRKSRGGLLLPSQSVTAVCRAVEQKIKIMMKLQGSIPSKTTFFACLRRETVDLVWNNNIFPKLDAHCFDIGLLETPHKKILVEEIIKDYSTIRLNSLARDMNEYISGPKIRKTFNKLILFKHQ